MNPFPKYKDITREQSRDTGMAMVLLLLIIFLVRKRHSPNSLIVAAVAVHVLNMIAPQIYRPVAVVWLGLSHAIGTVVSKILLSVVFFLVVTPIAVIRRMMGKDSMNLRAFKADTASSMVERNHVFVAQDLEKPY